MHGTGLSRTAGPSSSPVQPTLDDIGTPLSAVTFVVVDLETTGGSPTAAAITEIGAVKVRGGEVLGEFQTLVDPGGPVPAFIAALTGITSSMVRGQPRIEQVLPAFFEFSRGAVLVAHNAPFDIGFLKAAARDHGYPWPGNQVLDTVALARRAVTRDEVPNHKLSTLAAFFRTAVAPEHRALSDARATVAVLHACLARLGPLGITHLEDLATATDPVPPERRRKRHLADGLPDTPGVYQFRGAGGEVLYVGTATSIRSRVRSYFTAAEQRRRMTEMVALAEQVVPIVCGTVLEAQVRELRLIASESPRYNRRSRSPERLPWVRLTAETYPRLSVVRQVRADGGPRPGEAEAHIGPFSGQAAALQALQALQVAFPSCGSAPDGSPASPSPTPVRVRWPTWAGAARRASARSPSGTTPPSSRRSAMRCSSTPHPLCRPTPPGSPRSPRRSGSRRRPSGATSWRRSCVVRPARNGRAGSPRIHSSWRRSRTPTVAGRSSSSGTAGCAPR